MSEVKGLLAWFFAIIVLSMLLFGCTKTVKSVSEVTDTLYVSKQQTVRHDSITHSVDTIYLHKIDTLLKTDVRHDSIVMRDSVYIRERGDSVYVYREKWNTKVDVRHDTVYHSKTDTVYRHKTDTIYIYSQQSASDTIKSVSNETTTKVKEKSSFSKWLVCIIAFGVASVIFFAIRLFRNY